MNPRDAFGRLSNSGASSKRRQELVVRMKAIVDEIDQITDAAVGEQARLDAAVANGQIARSNFWRSMLEDKVKRSNELTKELTQLAAEIEAIDSRGG